MSKQISNTAEDYEDMVGYESDDLKTANLAEFLGEVYEQKPSIKEKTVDPDFPESWQTLIVNFTCFEDYAKFMTKIGSAPLPKLKKFIFSSNKSDTLEDFFGD